MMDAMEAKFQFPWSVMYSPYEEFEEKLSLLNKFINLNVYLLYYFALWRIMVVTVEAVD